jgi:hypothetical protein
LKGEVMVKTITMWSDYFKVNTQNEYTTMDSDTLVIILPGMGYGCMAPLLYYSVSVALELKYDVLTIEYGYKDIERKIKLEELDYVYEDARKVIHNCLSENTYKNIVVIGKSIGTYVMSRLTKDFDEYDGKYVYLTPVNICLDGMKKVNALVVIGADDQCLSNDDIDRLQYYNNIKLILVPGNHCLDTPNYKESLEVLGKTIKEIELFIK